MRRWVMGRWVGGLLLGALCGTVTAGSIDTLHRQVAASLLVTGVIVVAPDGHVATYAIDHPEQLPPAVRQLVDRAIPSWRFKPVVRDGVAVQAKAPMNLRVVAKPLDGERFTLGVGAVSFGSLDDADVPLEPKAPKPHYPIAALQDQVSGTAYVLLRLSSEGKVEQAVTEQVDLRVVGSPAQMAAWRKILGDSAVRALASWTFSFRPGHARDMWLCVPVDYSIVNLEKPAKPGDWQVYVPGPRMPLPAGSEQIAGDPDAFPSNGIYLAKQGLTLLAPTPGI